MGSKSVRSDTPFYYFPLRRVKWTLRFSRERSVTSRIFKVSSVDETQLPFNPVFPNHYELPREACYNSSHNTYFLGEVEFFFQTSLFLIFPLSGESW